MEKVRVYAHLVRVYGGGGGLFDYSVTSVPGLSKVKCQVPSYTRLGQGQGQGA